MLSSSDPFGVRRWFSFFHEGLQRENVFRTRVFNCRTGLNARLLPFLLPEEAMVLKSGTVLAVFTSGDILQSACCREM